MKSPTVEKELHSLFIGGFLALDHPPLGPKPLGRPFARAKPGDLAPGQGGKQWG